MLRPPKHLPPNGTNPHSNTDNALKRFNSDALLSTFIESSRLQQLDNQLRRAGALQRSLQRPPPALKDAEIRTFYSPAEVISGDTYDVVRLDESHIAFSIADATGHELSAALLSTFVKRSLQDRRPWPGASRMLEPDEVLARANHDLLEAQLEECLFVTAVYAIYDERTQVIRWARAGAPYPVLVGEGRTPRPLISDGPLLGVLPDARFQVIRRKLEPGDTMVFHTDGLDILLGGKHDGPEPQRLHKTVWFRGLCSKPVPTQLDRLERLVQATDQKGSERDDVTLLTLQVHEQEQPAAEHPSISITPRAHAPQELICATLS